MSEQKQTWPTQISAWITQEKHKSKIIQLRADVEKAFTDHPEHTGETYLQHLWFTFTMSSRFAYVWLVILIHGIFPFLCTRTASTQIETVYRIMKTRIPQKRREEIDREIPNIIRIPTHRGEPRIAVVGGGFSGALTVANLIRKSDGNLTIEWFESNGTLGTGIAYGTKDPVHLLNVRAGRMGAYAGQPDDFYRWLQTDEGKSHAERIIPGVILTAESFAPRALYAEYLRHIVQTALAEAKEKGINIRTSHATVIDAELHDDLAQHLTLITERGGLQQEVLVDAVVLATGNLPPRNFHFQTGLITGKDNYIEDPWSPSAGHIFPHRIHELPATSEIVVIGTGLTMVDTVLTLKTRGYKGTITAISRNGLMPAPHTHCKPYPEWEWVLAPHFAPRTALGMFRRLRDEIQHAEKQGYDWRSVIDSIRPVTQQLWQQLSINERRKFLNRFFTLWNIHRHRMAPDIYTTIHDMQQSGSLNVIAGKIYYVGSDKEGLTVAYRKRGRNRVETVRPTLVINCTGPEYDIAASRHILLRNLRDRELITVGPLRAGIETTSYGTARGKASESLFPMGTLLVGEYLECTAIPELREQASDTALRVLKRIQSLYEQGDYHTNLAVGSGI